MVFHGECNPPDALAGRRNRRLALHPPGALDRAALARVRGPPQVSADTGSCEPLSHRAAPSARAATPAHSHWPRYMALPTACQSLRFSRATMRGATANSLQQRQQQRHT